MKTKTTSFIQTILIGLNITFAIIASSLDSSLDSTLSLLLGFGNVVFFLLLRNKERISQERSVKTSKDLDNQLPPKFAEYLLYFIHKKDREPMLGDLEEEYREVYGKFGKRKAIFWYYCQVAMSFWPYIASAIKKLVGWGVVGWLSNTLRRLIG